MPKSRVLVALVSILMIARWGLGAGSPPAALPYQDDPAIIQAIANLGDRASLSLPKLTVDAASDIYGCRTVGPVTRGYTMRMA